MRTIGRIEEVNLIDIGFEGLVAKIDSGAFTSALHAQSIKRFNKDGEKFVRFRLLDKTHELYEDKFIELPLHKVKLVKSSNGFAQKRYSIRTRMKLGGRIYKVEFTLTDRKDMKSPILLGSKFLRRKFLIDVSKKHLLSK